VLRALGLFNFVLLIIANLAGVNVVVNENDMQIIADIVYNDVNIQLLFSGYGLFLALVNVFGFYLIMVSQDRSA